MEDSDDWGNIEIIEFMKINFKNLMIKIKI